MYMFSPSTDINNNLQTRSNFNDVQFKISWNLKYNMNGDRASVAFGNIQS